MDVNHDEMAQLLTQELVRPRHLPDFVPTAKINIGNKPVLVIAQNLYMSVAVVDKSVKTLFSATFFP